MNELINGLQDNELLQVIPIRSGDVVRKSARRLEECRALLQRLADDEPAPEGHTFQSWARELLV